MIQIQILGDSLTKRLEYFVNREGSKLKLEYSMGISGATIGQLKKQIKITNPYFNSEIPLLLWIGTNDIFSNTSITMMTQQYVSLLRVIRKRYLGTRLILLGLPYFPRSEYTPHTIDKITQFNTFLHTLSNQNTQPIFLTHVLNSNKYYLHTYRHSNRRDDIHLNNIGNQILVKHLTHQLQ